MSPRIAYILRFPAWRVKILRDNRRQLPSNRRADSQHRCANSKEGLALWNQPLHISSDAITANQRATNRSVKTTRTLMLSTR